MKIQANEQTKDGVWGVVLSGWEDALPEPAFSHWMTKEEAGVLAATLTPMSIQYTIGAGGCASVTPPGTVTVVETAGWAGPPNGPAPEGGAK